MIIKRKLWFDPFFVCSHYHCLHMLCTIPPLNCYFCSYPSEYTIALFCTESFINKFSKSSLRIGRMIYTTYQYTITIYKPRSLNIQIIGLKKICISYIHLVIDYDSYCNCSNRIRIPILTEYNHLY